MEKIFDTIPVIVCAKCVIRGSVKTRIAASAGSAAALKIYRELLAETARIVDGTTYHVAFTGHRHPLELANVFSRARSFFRQTGDTLGKRMRNACERMYALGSAACIVIGCDCPYITQGILRQAADYLAHSADVVLGPANDGGYYLIGCKPLSLSVFNAGGWGKPNLLSETIEIIRRDQYCLNMLDPLSDIDTIEDYSEWKSKCNKTIIERRRI